MWKFIFYLVLAEMKGFGTVIKERPYPQLTSIPSTNFTCFKKYPGYYADPSPNARCQLFHVCDPQGRKFTYLCPNKTLFDQALLTCDYWFHVDCSSAEGLYDVNKQLYISENINYSSRQRRVHRKPTIREPYKKENSTPLSNRKSQIFATSTDILEPKECRGCMKYFIRDSKSCSPCVWPR
ncbi:U-scoloptoxin(01)-Er1a-like [Tachypleus tridentatus]|uniref:U-scoloptoxin(01)-Er1a-like n=1 Tax=Tachypleus tridentatus TaxID=6853 RepID=UPI003FCF1EAB